MKIQSNAVNVLERTSAYLRSGLLTQQPIWYNVVASVPPSKKFQRKARFVNPSNEMKLSVLNELNDNSNKEGIYKTRYHAIDKKSSGRLVYAPPKLKYMEDQLREIFFQQHPWELSRPKILVENEGNEIYDWSRMQQIGKPLDGESVVQRTLHLFKNKNYGNLINAYDQARFEFYRLRMQQEIEEQVAQEESEMFGSVFGPSSMDYGIEREQKVIDTWKKKAIAETEILAAKSANPSESWSNTEHPDKKTSESEQDYEELQL